MTAEKRGRGRGGPGGQLRLAERPLDSTPSAEPGNSPEEPARIAGHSDKL